jgi:hypothetical protein
MKEPKSGAYSSQVIEFITVSDQFCKHLMRARSYKPSEFISIMQRLLPLLYLKAVVLPKFEPVFEEGNERFVREEEYKLIESSIAFLLGQFDSFEEPYDQYLHESGEPVAASVSEYLADMYQDIKDCILQYRTGTEDVMNDAIWECSLNFETVWGKKLLSVLRAIHRIVYSVTDIDEAVSKDKGREEGYDTDKSDWFISRRQEDYGDE